MPVVEAMRGFAAIAVTLDHLSTHMTSTLPWILKTYAFAGVDVFFVISGCVIPLSLYGKNYGISQFPRFMLRRLVRLEPPYLASIVLGIVLAIVAARAVPGYRGGVPT